MTQMHDKCKVVVTGFIDTGFPSHCACAVAGTRKVYTMCGAINHAWAVTATCRNTLHVNYN
jgi:hypothetical protein